MSRRTQVELAAVVVLAAVVAILFLNIREVDDYPPGLTLEEAARPAGFPPWLPPILIHPCEACQTCSHKFETAECRLAVTILDRDGWYRLFWSAPETYVYDDPAYVGAALRHRTAELSEGTWTIRGRYEPDHKAAAHPCPAAARDVDLRYRLKRGSFPGMGDPAPDPSGTLAAPRRVQWFRYRFPPDREDDFWWELENPETFAGTVKTPCPCSGKLVD